MDAIKKLILTKECEDLILEVAWLTDHGPQINIADLFSSNGTFSRDGEVFVGTSSLVDTYKKRPVGLFTRHVMSNIGVKILSEIDAVATSYATVFRYRSADGGISVPPVISSGPESVLEYHDVLTKESGSWKIQSRELKTMINSK